MSDPERSVVMRTLDSERSLVVVDIESTGLRGSHFPLEVAYIDADDTAHYFVPYISSVPNPFEMD